MGKSGQKIIHGWPILGNPVPFWLCPVFTSTSLRYLVDLLCQMEDQCVKTPPSPLGFHVFPTSYCSGKPLKLISRHLTSFGCQKFDSNFGKFHSWNWRGLFCIPARDSRKVKSSCPSCGLWQRRDFGVSDCALRRIRHLLTSLFKG